MVPTTKITRKGTFRVRNEIPNKPFKPTIQDINKNGPGLNICIDSCKNPLAQIFAER